MAPGMNPKLTMLRAADAGPVSSVVDAIEDVLDRARRGEIVSVAIAAVSNRRGSVTSYDLGAGDVAGLVCAGRRLERRLLDHCEDV
jgi:hypothetical protein